MAFRWRADDGPTLNAGLVHVALLFFNGSGPVLLNKPYIFCNFSGGSGPPAPTPSESAHGSFP